MASSADKSPEPDEFSFSAPIIACLTVHIAGQGSKKKITKKDTKTKEFSHIFCATKSNYLEFLTTFLTKHHIGNKLRVTDRRHYTCKMQVPPSIKGDACDVENFLEYEDVVKKVLERRPTKAITVFVDMKDVDCAVKKLSFAHMDGFDSSLMLPQHSNGLTKLDSELARLRGLLEKKYSNNHDTGYTYIDSATSDSIPLTPFMMKEWACAMVSYDGTVSVSHPPSTATFDPVNRRSSLHTHHHHSKSALAPASSNA
ncbi:hypothetical protein F5888DRAFT_1616438 [Russula emetica]|nr:hypothetical protein F5888DRAFT_1616438 [Russula emetica]